MTEIPFIERI